MVDAAALTLSTVDVPNEASAVLCIRAGYLALRDIADFFSIPYNLDPHPSDPISISRQEFDAACNRLAEVGVPLKPDREQAWRDFGGWRVNYDSVLLDLAGLTMAPKAPWSGDRATRFRTPPLVRPVLHVGGRRPKTLSGQDSTSQGPPLTAGGRPQTDDEGRRTQVEDEADRWSPAAE